MSIEESRHPTYSMIWLWLVLLLAVGLLLTSAPVARAVAVFLIFAIAVLKAGLVARYFMHIPRESLLVRVIIGVPVLLLIGMTLALVPDVVFNR